VKRELRREVEGVLVIRGKVEKGRFRLHIFTPRKEIKNGGITTVPPWVADWIITPSVGQWHKNEGNTSPTRSCAKREEPFSRRP